jgi:hypothetical protein
LSAEAYTTFPSSQQYKKLETATCIAHLDFMRTVVGIFSTDVPKMDKVPILNRVLDLEVNYVLSVLIISQERRLLLLGRGRSRLKMPIKSSSGMMTL